MIVELRRYTLRAGRRDELIELFGREFIAPQEQLGMRVLGWFRDLDRDDGFVWLRGFADMAVRRTGLEAFYGGPVWREHGPAANATMLDSDDVLLLRPTSPVPDRLDGEVFATIWYQDRPFEPVPPGDETAAFVTAYDINDFPRLPVREGVHALVRLDRTAVDRPVPPGVRAERLRLAGC
ncbi:NIPSNAP family protein [Actinoplanes sp. G11-F43]|uniref:NIPSNAP family protein n=1 Tax=Actinoplanes sp. G11-F43 TaxID=3424130 RepID=UPI003D328CFE